VIAWGGDGTINEAAGPLIGTTVSLGIVPSGSGDGLARGLGLSRDPATAFGTAIGPAAPSSTLAGSAIATSSTSPASVSTPRSRRPSTIAARAANVATSSTAFAASGRTNAAAIKLRRGRTASMGRALWRRFANCRQYGSGIVMAPEADPADGQLDMVLVTGGPPWRQLWRARRLGFRRMAAAEGVTRARITSARVTGEHLHAHVDGQTFEAHGILNVRIEPKALLIAVK
jgi:diacylglycerol kinase (ATP)